MSIMKNIFAAAGAAVIGAFVLGMVSDRILSETLSDDDAHDEMSALASVVTVAAIATMTTTRTITMKRMRMPTRKTSRVKTTYLSPTSLSSVVGSSMMMTKTRMTPTRKLRALPATLKSPLPRTRSLRKPRRLKIRPLTKKKPKRPPTPRRSKTQNKGGNSCER